VWIFSWGDQARKSRYMEQCSFVSYSRDVADQANSGMQARILQHAQSAGFAQAGIAAIPRVGDASADRHAEYFAHWVESGYAGEMDYLKRKDSDGRYLRSAVEVAAPWARSIVVCAAPYGGGADFPRSTDFADQSSAWIARYAWSGTQVPGAEEGHLVPSDYHKVLLSRLKQLEAAIQREFEPVQSWAYVDTGPVVERAYAAIAGLGWTGKNTCTLSETLGSFFFLGIILTSLELPAEGRAALQPDRCGSCTRCLEACPTQALIAPGQMDASRCISYLTIEHRGSIDLALRSGIGRNVFGCDICQDVCPWNERALQQKATRSIDPELQPRPSLINPPLSALAVLTEAEWQALFFGSPVKRAKFSGFQRNLAIAMGNSEDAQHLPCLRAWAADEDLSAVVREAASWAIKQLQSGVLPVVGQATASFSGK
jgi:epoxyqueuosine reductase